MSERAVLITGADGYLGRLLVEHLLATTDTPLLLWVRAASPSQAVSKCTAALGSSTVNTNRVRCTGGDLRDADPFAGADPRRVSGIVHLAAITSFTVDAAAANANNVQGTARVLEFARRCPTLAGLCLASTLYVSGLRSGLIPEAGIDGTPEFANHYERSKWQAEGLALAAPDLPVSIVRVATILADDLSGTVTQSNAVHNTLQLLFHGLLTLMPGSEATPLHLTSGAIAVRALSAALNRGEGVYHAADDIEHSLTLGEALGIAFDTFADDPGFARRRARRPRFVDLRTFQMMGDAAGSMGGSVLGQALGSLMPFAPQLYVTKQIATARLRELEPAIEPLAAAALFAAACRYLLEQRNSRARAS